MDQSSCSFCLLVALAGGYDLRSTLELLATNISSEPGDQGYTGSTLF